MEERRIFDSIRPTIRDLATLSRQNRPDLAGDVGGLGAAHGHHLFAALSGAVSAFQSGPDLLGSSSHLHDEPILGRGEGGRDAIVREKSGAITIALAAAS